MRRGADRDPIRLGRITLAVIAVAAAAVMSVPRVEDSVRRRYELELPPGQDLHGLTIQSKIRVGGLERGRVEAIRPRYEAGRLAGTTVTLAIDPSVRLFAGAEASVVRELVSGLAWISIAGLGAGPRAIGDGDPIALRPRRDEVTEILDRFGSRHDLQELASAFRTVQSGWGDAQRDAEGLLSDIRTSWPALEAHARTTADRFGRIGDELAALRDRIRGLQSELEALEKSLTPPFRAVEADFEAIRAGFAMVGERLEATFVPAESWIDRELERVISAAHAIEHRFLALGIGRHLAETFADGSLLGGEFGRLVQEVFSQPWRVLGSDSPAARRRGELDHLSRDLLLALEEARVAEEALRRMAAAGAAGADFAPRLAEALAAMDGLLEAGRMVETALYRLRLEDGTP